MASGSSGKVGRFTINGPLLVDWSIRKRCCNLPRMKTRIGILTSGGDCPGLNAVLRGAALAADKIGWEMLGFRDGFEGLLPPSDVTGLDGKCTGNIMALGATLLGATNVESLGANVG